MLTDGLGLVGCTEHEVSCRAWGDSCCTGLRRWFYWKGDTAGERIEGVAAVSSLGC